MIVARHETVEWEPVDALDETERGGHSNVKERIKASWENRGVKSNISFNTFYIYYIQINYFKPYQFHKTLVL